MTHDIAPSALIGTAENLLSAPRLDNQGTCYAGLRALLDGSSSANTRMLALFDHEEVGSGSERGAASDFLASVCERIVLARGGSRSDYLQAMAASVCLSGDMAHATHPNYPERHEPGHRISIGGGPVLKVNQNLRYASDALGGKPSSRWPATTPACRCSATSIGRICPAVRRSDRSPRAVRDWRRSTSGAPQLAMHSARELMGAADVPMYSAALQAFLAQV